VQAGEAAGMNRGRSSLPRSAGWRLNVVLRLLIIAFVVEALLATGDPRFDGKGIAIRNLVLAGAVLTLSVPAFHAVRGRGRPYPIWLDVLLLSVIAVDMAGNSLGLYDQGWRFDLIPHAYGPFAGFSILHSLGMAAVPSALVVNGVHVLHEIQEAAGDAWFGTHNVRGAWDTATDLLAGIVGSVAVPVVWHRLRRRRPATPQTPASA
jgi:hypothetical protein